MRHDLSTLQRANTEFRQANFACAAELYTQALRRTPELYSLIAFNLQLATDKAAAQQSSSRRSASKYQLLNEQYTVDIVVPVYNALADVKQCMTALNQYTDGFSIKVYVVNDASENETSDWLNEFCSRQTSFNLIENKNNLGYTATVNRGLRKTSADYVVTLNSDTIVTEGWLTCLIRCMQSDPQIGIAGPLSNAASWQTVPFLYNRGGFAVNDLPENFTPNTMAQVVRMASLRMYPRVPFVNGFCFTIDRRVLDAVGVLDEETFPTGYGEENDYCLRAAEAGFTLAIADDAYVFHAKSKSFGHDTRKILAKRGGSALKAKHGVDVVNEKANAVRGMESLQEIRDRVQRAQEEEIKRLAERVYGLSGPSRILFCLPVSGGGGGVHSIVQETVGLNRLGLVARIGVPNKHLNKFLSTYSDIPEVEKLFVGVGPTRWVDVARGYDVLVGTIFTSMKIVDQVIKAHPRILPAYYVQDYEPFFFEPGTDNWATAHESYRLLPQATLFAKTDWIRTMILEEHGIYVHKVSPSIDHSVYYPYPHAKARNHDGAPAVVSAMIRPKTPRRGANRTMQVLSHLKQSLGDAVSIEIFGVEESDPFFKKSEFSDLDYVCHGILTRPQVASVLQGADVFLDLSDYQAFGRTALEAMATGCYAVVPLWGGASEYARSAASLAIDPFSPDLAETVTSVIAERIHLGFGQSRTAAIETAKVFSIERAALSEARVLGSTLAANTG